MDTNLNKGCRQQLNGQMMLKYTNVVKGNDFEKKRKENSISISINANCIIINEKRSLDKPIIV